MPFYPSKGLLGYHKKGRKGNSEKKDSFTVTTSNLFFSESTKGIHCTVALQTLQCCIFKGENVSFQSLDIQ